MLDNPLRIMTFMWLASGFLLAGQALITGPIGIDMVTPDGESMKPYLLSVIDDDLFNTATDNIIMGTNGTWDRVDDLDTSGAFIVWELVQLMSGIYIFNVLRLFGIPVEIVIVIAMGYGALLARSIVGYVFGR